MRRTTAPPETFSHSPPISSRTRCHDDPSGARVAILITVGPAYAAARKVTRGSRTARPLPSQTTPPPPPAPPPPPGPPGGRGGGGGGGVFLLGGGRGGARGSAVP